jgi:hypothetical protein
MESKGYPEQDTIAVQLRQILLDLARRHDDVAHVEAAAVPYWAPHPASVSGHRAAANSLRVEADRILQTA